MNSFCMEKKIAENLFRKSNISKKKKTFKFLIKCSYIVLHIWILLTIQTYFITTSPHPWQYFSPLRHPKLYTPSMYLVFRHRFKTLATAFISILIPKPKNEKKRTAQTTVLLINCTVFQYFVFYLIFVFILMFFFVTFDTFLFLFISFIAVLLT